MADIFIKDPNSVETFTVVYASKSNLNDGTASDSGELQGETISTAVATVPAGITLDSDNQNQTAIQGVTYAINTVHNIVLSSGTAGTDYAILSRITTSGNRTLDKTITIICQET